MDRHQPLVSVIIPAYNAEGTLPQVIGSVQAQTLPDWEIVVTNDGSTDNTLGVLHQLAETDPRIRVLDQPNAGAGSARNAAVAVARGRFIKFLDADDLLETGCLEALVPLARDHGAACGSWTLDDAQGVPLGITVPMRTAAIGLDRLLEDNPVAPSAAMLSREVMSLEPFSNAPAAADYDLWLRLARHGVVWQTVPQVVARYRLLATSNSKKCAAALGQVTTCLRQAYEWAADDHRIDTSPQRLARVLRAHALKYATLHALLKPSPGQDDAADLFESAWNPPLLCSDDQMTCTLPVGGHITRAHIVPLSGMQIGDAAYEGVLGVLARRPSLGPPTPQWVGLLLSWWEAIASEGWAEPDFEAVAVERFAQRLTEESVVIDRLLDGIKDEVILIGHGTNGRTLERAAEARGLRVRVRDDRYDSGVLAAPENAEPMDAPWPRGVQGVVTPLTDAALVGRFPLLRRWRAERDLLASAHIARLYQLLLPNLAA